MSVYDKYTVRKKAADGPAKVDKVGETPDGKYNIITGLFFIFQDGSKRLSEVLQMAKTELQAIPDWSVLYCEARVEGWPHSEIIRVLDYSIPDVWGTEIRDVVLKHLKESRETLENFLESQRKAAEAAKDSKEAVGT